MMFLSFESPEMLARNIEKLFSLDQYELDKLGQKCP